jgi:beta-lactamase class A
MLLEQLSETMDGLPFEIGVAATRLDETRSFFARQGDAFPAASVIKVPVALTALDAFAAGRLDASEKVVLRDDDKVTGSGVLGHLAAGAVVTLSDLVYLATAISDNTATNMLIERVGVEAINATLTSLGCSSTRLTGKILVDETRGTDTPAGKGETSPSTPSDLLRLMLHASRHPALLALLRETQTASAIGRGLPDTRFLPEPPIKMAYKTGSIRGVVAEAAIVEIAGAAHTSYAIAIMTSGVDDLRPTPDNVARVAITKIAAALHAHLTA